MYTDKEWTNSYTQLKGFTLAQVPQVLNAFSIKFYIQSTIK